MLKTNCSSGNSAMAKQQDKELGLILVEEREEHMVSIIGDNSTLRTARFLKPSNTHVEKPAKTPVLCGIIAYADEKRELFDVLFKGGKRPKKKWKEWVDHMSAIHGEMWKVTGIYHAIIASTYEIRKDREMVLGLVEWWCPETNTFVFPWGEATIALEDLMFLGGFSVLGEPITTPLTEGLLLDIEKKMIRESKKASLATAWIEHFMMSNSELELVAFLALWLSRYVFPHHPEYVVSKQVFPIAVHLSNATRIALAPAVLASIYRDLRVLVDRAVGSSSSTRNLKISLWAPFQFMQMWAWERIPSLRPKPNPGSVGEPRAARWHKVFSKRR
ncbi:hypothetical protein GIB67_019462 [Kingdonia uniflora]|uniref:Aminotransferase-like plant mobile domain-containing protein n=1 Tax=Kingdonia uniflora TaxID=39325 RepID=A0A7J7MU68_9MAGN|nr:hypothetical protein GIB67_019462 [Kingdonia uniflora]